MTNADRIRAMTDEELAVFIADPHMFSSPWCLLKWDCPHLEKDPVPCILCALDWLKQEVQE